MLYNSYVFLTIDKHKVIFDIFKRKRKKIFKKMMLEVKNNIDKDREKVSELFVRDGKYNLLNNNLQCLLRAMQEEAKNSQWHNIKFEMPFKIIRNGTKITLTIKKDDVLDFISFSTSNYYNNKMVESCITNVYKTLSNMQFYLQDTKDKEFIQEQIKNLSDFSKEEPVEPLTKGIQMIVDEMKNRNTKNDKSNELIIESIGYINRLLNTTKNYNDLIDKIKILKSVQSDLDIQNSIDLLFKNFFETTKNAVEKHLIDQGIFNNDKHVKLIQEFINLFPKEKKEEFTRYLNEIVNCNGDINQIYKSMPDNYKLRIGNGLYDAFKNYLETNITESNMKVFFQIQKYVVCCAYLKNEEQDDFIKEIEKDLNSISEIRDDNIINIKLSLMLNNLNENFQKLSQKYRISTNQKAEKETSEQFSSITPQSSESSLQTQENKSRWFRIMARRSCPIPRNKC